MIITVQLIRHGKTKGNLEKRFAGGKTDESLCTQGIFELMEFRNQEIYDDCDIVFSSPMKRCLETAGIIWPEKKAYIIEDFREFDFGIFENKNHEELDGNIEYQKWIDSNGEGDVPGGENFKEFSERVMAGFYKMISDAGKAKTGAAVHGGTIMAILSSLNGGKYYEYLCRNGRGYSLEISVEEMKLVSLRKI